MTKEQKEIMKAIQKNLRLLEELIESLLSASNDSSEMLALVKSEEKAETKDLEELVTEYLNELRIPAHLKGYHYLRDALKMSIEDMSCVKMVTILMYPEIAKKYDTTPSRVERAIRHAVEVMCARKNTKLLKEIFGYVPEKRPANSEVIATIADYIRIKEMR